MIWSGLLGSVMVAAASSVVVASSVLAPGAAAGDGTVAAGPGEHPVGRTAEVVVAPGDTLWTIALDHAPTEDPRSVIETVGRINGLDPAAPLPVGQVLVVPVE
jgi:nucleoid-associated protein YgaU